MLHFKLTNVIALLAVSAFANDPFTLTQPTQPVNGQVRVDNQDPTRVIEPWGDWQYCEPLSPLFAPYATTRPSTVNCTKVSLGHETFRYRLKAHHDDTRAYVVTFKCDLWPTGGVFTTSAITQRQDDKDGFTDIIVDPGAQASSCQHNSEEYRQQ